MNSHLNWLFLLSIFMMVTAIFPDQDSTSTADSIATSENFTPDSSDAVIDTLMAGFRDSSTKDTSADSLFLDGIEADTSSRAAGDLITIEGILLDSISGTPPSDTAIRVILENKIVKPDSTGGFSVSVLEKSYYVVYVKSSLYESINKTIVHVKDKMNYFVTILLTEKKKQTSIDTVAVYESKIPWSISGTIIDSRFDLAVESEETVLLFDSVQVPYTNKGVFSVNTNRSGEHSFDLSIPGYHHVVKTVFLNEAEKQPFIIIPTTLVSKEITRREITVSAKSQEVHTSSSVAKIPVSRVELQRSAATLNDPLRAVQTLPGVTSQSDMTVQPVVRGGDVLEARVFLDGIPLIEPYHFGGIRSSFNQSAVENLTLYKSGFPAEYHGAQSAIINVSSRMPLQKKPFSLDLDLNFLQYSAYLGIPVYKNKLGLNFSSQGSYFDFIAKRIMGIISRTVDNSSIKDMTKMINFPDYQDFTGGIVFKPNNKLQVYVSDCYNTDRAKLVNAPDSFIDATYHYDYDDNGTYDSVRNSREFYDSWNSPYVNQRNPYPYDDNVGYYMWDSVSYGKPYFEADTIVQYKSRYNILYGTARYMPDDKNIFTVSGAWQKRWWDLNFPDDFMLELTSIYDVSYDQYNGSFGWRYTGLDKHLLKAGFQIDYTRASYKVLTPRLIHEFITTGSTNLQDVWGPINGDTATNFSFIEESSVLSDRVIIGYNGSRRYYNFSLYAHDSWDATKKLTVDAGARLEISLADTSCTVSPRISIKYNLTPKNELIASLGHYTQNNYNLAAIALSDDLKPEKTWHAGLGVESKLLPWLTQKVDVYTKYYYDLLSEIITKDTTATLSEMLQFLQSQGQGVPETEEDLAEMINAFFLKYASLNSSYINNGKGVSYGFEYFLRFEPTDFWHGWISLSLGQSLRQRAPGWRWHRFPLERPLLISVSNYYRLPRRYELSLQYRFMSGIPYTSIATNANNTVSIGDFNNRRYQPYHRLDLKFSKGFTIKDAKCHFYFEIWNILDISNILLRDSKSNKFQSFSTNLPVTMPFIGLDCKF